MPRSYISHCKRGSGKRYHAPSGQCRTPCKKSHGAGHRRSPKAPYYPCIKSNAKGKKRNSSRLKKVYSAGKIIAALRKYSARNKA